MKIENYNSIVIELGFSKKTEGVEFAYISLSSIGAFHFANTGSKIFPQKTICLDFFLNYASTKADNVK